MFKHTASNIPGYFLCYYIPSKQDTTVLSSLLLDFKKNKSRVVDELSEWASDEILKEDIKISMIVRSLNSNEIEASDKTSLDELGYCIAESLGATYKPTILRPLRVSHILLFYYTCIVCWGL